MTIHKISTLPVNSTLCHTCPFRLDGDIALRNTVMQRVLTKQSSQICHGTEGPNRKAQTLCRGARNELLQMFYRIGFLEAATDEAWNSARARLGV